MGSPHGDSIGEALSRLDNALRDAVAVAARAGTAEGRPPLLRALRDASGALRRARELAERADEPRGGRSRAAHDLRTPLTAILGWVQLVRGKAFEKSITMQAIDTIERNATLLAEMVDRLGTNRRRPAA